MKLRMIAENVIVAPSAFDTMFGNLMRKWGLDTEFGIRKPRSSHLKEEVDYHKVSLIPGERCGGCEFFVHDSGCELVLGRINPHGRCDLYEKAEESDSHANSGTST